MNSTQQIHGFTVKAHGTSEPIPDASGTGMIEVAAPSGALAVGTGSGVWDDPHFQLAAEHFGYIDHAPIAVTDREVIALADFLRGKIKAPTWQHFEHVLRKHGLVDPCAFDDPEGYDNYRTHGAAHAAYRELLSPNGASETRGPNVPSA